MHKRTIIRQKVQALLQTGVASISNEFIYNFRILRLPEKALAALSVYTLNETITKFNSEDDLDRRLDVYVAAWVKGQDASRKGVTDPVDNRMDNLLEEIEAATFKKFQTLNETVFRLDPQDVKISPSDDGDTIILQATMRFEAQFFTTLT